MIIDLILDRKDGVQYDARSFYNYVCESERIFEFPNLNISGALEYGTNEDVQNELCEYIEQNGYNLSICDYIRSVSWVED